MEVETVRRKKVWERGLLILGLFVLLGFSTYWNSLDNSFHYDDETIVIYNRNIYSLKNLPRFFINPLMYTSDPNWATHYRPLVAASYSIDYAINKLKPLSYHVTNIAFHVGSAFLLFLIVKVMLGGISSFADKSPMGLRHRAFQIYSTGVIIFHISLL